MNIEETHKHNLKRALLSSKYFTYHEAIMRKRLQFLFKGAGLSGVTAFAVLAFVFLPVTSSLNANQVLAQANENLEESSEQEGRYLYLKESIVFYENGQVTDQYTEESYEDFETDDWMSNTTDQNGNVVGRAVYTNGQYFESPEPADVYSIITEEDWDTLSMAQIDAKLVEAGLQPIFDPSDPEYNFTPAELENLTDEEWDELYKDYDPFNGVISDEDFDTLTMQEINKKLIAAGQDPVFEENDPLFTMTPEQIDALSDEEIEQLYIDADMSLDQEDEDFDQAFESSQKAIDSIFESLWEDDEPESLEALLADLQGQEGVEYIGASTKFDTTVETLAVTKTVNEHTVRVELHFDAQTFDLRGISEYETNNGSLELVVETFVVEESFSNTPFVIDTNGLELVKDVDDFEDFDDFDDDKEDVKENELDDLDE